MNLLSLNFWLVVLVTFVVYYITPSKHRWAVLLIASYYFYSTTGYKYISYILLTTLTTYFSALKIDKINKKKSVISKRNDKEMYETLHNKSRAYLIGTLLFNFGILIFLKYYQFPAQILVSLGVKSDLVNKWRALQILLPLGISFYTFQAMGYLIDVFRAKYEATSHLGKFALFVSYFPQIIQGPISRFADLYSQFEEERPFDYDRMVKGLQLIIWGMFKKLVIADRAAVVVNEIYGNYTEYTGIVIFFGALFYAIQIYGDFSGGIDIIKGISEVLGVYLTDNFRRPYFARSVSDFWKRWHITLGSWMRDYVFYSLALSKKFGMMGRKLRKKFGNHIGKQGPAALSSIVVFIIVGAWHGSSVKFIAYGIYNGIFVLSEPLFEPAYAKMRLFFGIKNTESGTFIVFQILRTLFITTTGRIFSRASSFRASMSMYGQMFKEWNPWVLFDQTLYNLGLDKPEMTVLFFALLLLFVVSYAQENGVKIRVWLRSQPLIFRWTLVITLIVIVVIYGYYGPGFSEQDFIYGGF